MFLDHKICHLRSYCQLVLNDGPSNQSLFYNDFDYDGEGFGVDDIYWKYMNDFEYRYVQFKYREVT